MQHYTALGQERYGGLMEFGIPLLLVKDLSLARTIFIKDFHHFSERRDVPNSSDTLITDSLFFMRGQSWKNMRTFLSPGFTSGMVRKKFPHFARSATNLQNWMNTHQKTSSGEYEIPVSDAMRKYAVEVIGAAAFGLNLNIFSDKNSKFLEMADRIENINVWQKFKFAIFQTFPRFADLFKISPLDSDMSKYFRNVLASAIEARELSSCGEKDFLQLLVDLKTGTGKIEVQAKQGDHKSREDLAVSQACLFLIAGFDTVANNLMVSTYMLATYPELQQKVREEVDRICGESEICYDHINEMGFLDNFIAETLRLYPGVPRLERKCVLDYPIPNSTHVIPKGTIVIVVAESVHKDAQYWTNPLRFDPDRFNLENKAIQNNNAYMPFGIGPRNCIGIKFALVETKLALATLVKHYEISGTETTQDYVPVKDLFGYKTHPDLKLRFKPRK
ncbi:cytochrome P450 6k1 isoform X2 [Folsomia candida]|nr:cytochrome P450 6k1 isoform X2 [Folsomia candida]